MALRHVKKIKLNKSFVDKCVANGLFWDSELPGFGLSVSGTTKSYVVQTRVNGLSKRRTIGRHGVYTPETARKAAKSLLLKMSNGIDPKAEQLESKEENKTLSEAFADYLSSRKLAARTANDYQGYLTRYFDDWASRPLTFVKPGMVSARHKELGEQHGAAQANVSMRFLRALFNFAEGKYLRANGESLITSNPTKVLSATKQWNRSVRRTGYIQEREFGRWTAAIESLRASSVTKNTDGICDYLLFLAFTGFRRTEAATLRWEYVDFNNGTITVPREHTKNRTEFQVPLTTVTTDILKRRWDARVNDYVFPGKGKSGHLVEPRPAMRYVTERTGIDFTLHDLRRTYATLASTVIENQFTVKRLMNHLIVGQDITQQYLQGVERLRKPAQDAADYIVLLSKRSV